MSTQEPLPAEPQSNAEQNGVPAELNDEAIQSLAGFFDVLIEMDLTAKQRND